jgi:hypothetical protein
MTLRIREHEKEAKDGWSGQSKGGRKRWALILPKQEGKVRGNKVFFVKR